MEKCSTVLEVGGQVLSSHEARRVMELQPTGGCRSRCGLESRVPCLCVSRCCGDACGSGFDLVAGASHSQCCVMMRNVKLC